MNQTQQENWTKQDLMEVAKQQKNILWMILISLVAMFIPGATIVTGAIQVYFIYKLATAVRSKDAWVYIILAFIPLVGLIALLVINGKATTKLRENGINVSLMGAKMADFEMIK
jgi:ABC-type enterochelin transport system permease subunit